jgi:hypothetical protein
MADEQQEQKSEEKFTFIYMKQVPKRTAEDFVKLANDEFSGHFGFCLKALLDQLIIQQTAYNEVRIDEIEKRISVLEMKNDEKQETMKRKRVGG